MGYTHYFNRPAKLGKKAFKLFSEDVKRIYEFAKENKIYLGDGFGREGSFPIANEDEVCFNGVGIESHEALVIERVKTDTMSDFCKTVRNPYDPIVVAVLIHFVVAVLIHFKHCFPEAKFDLKEDLGDLEEGAVICEQLFGYSV